MRKEKGDRVRKVLVQARGKRASSRQPAVEVKGSGGGHPVTPL